MVDFGHTATAELLANNEAYANSEEIILIHHTDCGMLTFTEEASVSSSSRTPARSR